MNEFLKKAVLAVFTPLVRYLIKQGWTYPAVSAVLKEAYVAAALGQSREPVTDARVSLLTGIHRKEVKRLRVAISAGAERGALRKEAGIAVRVIAEWVGNRQFLDSRGRPKVLLLRGANKPTFESVVRKVKADMRPRVVLDELLRAGAVELENDKVRLLRNAYVPASPDDMLAILGANVRDHLQSALHNLVGGEPYVERAVYYGVIDADDLDRLRPELNDRADRFLREINALVMPLNDSAMQGSPTKCRRMRLGVYYYEDDTMFANNRGNTPTGDPHEKSRK